MNYTIRTHHIYYSPAASRAKHPNFDMIEWQSGINHAIRNVRSVYRTLRKAGMYDWQARLAIISLMTARSEIVNRAERIETEIFTSAEEAR